MKDNENLTKNLDTWNVSGSTETQSISLVGNQLTQSAWLYKFLNYKVYIFFYTV